MSIRNPRVIVHVLKGLDSKDFFLSTLLKMNSDQYVPFVLIDPQTETNTSKSSTKLWQSGGRKKPSIRTW